MEQKILFYQYNDKGPDIFIGEGDFAGFVATLEKLLSEDEAKQIIGETINYEHKSRRSRLKSGQCYFIEQQEGI